MTTIDWGAMDRALVEEMERQEAEEEAAILADLDARAWAIQHGELGIPLAHVREMFEDTLGPMPPRLSYKKALRFLTVALGVRTVARRAAALTM